MLKLIKLKLTNFKGIKSFELNAEGQNVTVFGKNATGKTTLADAMFWLLFGKDTKNRSDYEIKTRNPDGTVKNHLEHKVEGVFEADGRILRLTRVYKEVYAKKRGSAKQTFSGNTTEYFVDGVPVAKRDYDALVNSILNEKLFKLLTNPLYFNEILTWQERRSILIEVCGDVSSKDVIATDLKLVRLKEIMGTSNFDEYELESKRKVILAARKEINKRLEELPSRIDEVERSLYNANSFKEDEIRGKLIKLKAERKNKEVELLQLKDGGIIAQKTAELNEVKSEIISFENAYREKVSILAANKRQALFEVRSTIDSLQLDFNSIKKQITTNEAEIEQINTKLDKLRAQWRQIYARQFEQEENCPTCGQSLSDEIKEKAKAEFNIKKSNELEENQKTGFKLKEKRDELIRLNNDLAQQAAEISKQLEAKKEELKKLNSEVDTLSLDIPENDASYKEVIKRKSKIEKEIATLRQESAGYAKILETEIEQIEDKINKAENDLLQLQQKKYAEIRIAELKEEEKKLVKEFEELESELSLIEQFIKVKVTLLTDKINSKFKLARFKLFETQINEGIRPTCETVFKGVPYNALNHGARINLGLDIINTLSQHYNFSAPIFIDNRESLTELIDVNAQVISLVVSETDDSLRVVLN